MSSTITKAEKHLQITQAIFGVKIQIFDEASNELLDNALLIKLMASFGDYCTHLNDRGWILALRQIQPQPDGSVSCFSHKEECLEELLQQEERKLTPIDI